MVATDILAFIDARLPTNIEMGAVGGPEYNTTVNATYGGWEFRNVNWIYSRGRWDVAHALKYQSELDDLIAFFRVMRGRATGFKFREWVDYRLSSTSGRVVAVDVVNHLYQITKAYTVGGQTFYRPIRKPVAAGLLVYVDGVLSTTHDLNAETGVIEFETTPTNVSIVGEFDVPVRFDTDSMKVRIDAYNVFSWDQIPIVEIRV